MAIPLCRRPIFTGCIGDTRREIRGSLPVGVDREERPSACMVVGHEPTTVTNDERQAALIAAAETLRTWVRTQRAGWDSVSLPFVAVHATADGSGVALPAIPVLTIEDVHSASPDAVDTLSGAPVENGSHATALSSLSAILSSFVGRSVTFTAAVLVRTTSLGIAAWRPLVALAVLAGVGWAGISYGPGAARSVKEQLVAAGRHVSVFDRAEPAEEEAKPVKRAAARPAVKRTGRVQVDSNPPGAQVMIDGQDRGVTPLTVGELPAGPHTIVLRDGEGSVERSITVSGDKTTVVNEAIFSGWLHVSSPIELEISEGTRAIRLDESNQVLLTPGPHELKFENKTYRFVDLRKVTVMPGDTALLNIQPPRSRLTITATTPAEVFVDGTLVGGTPLRDFPLDVGTREITVRNAAGDERRSTVTVTVDPVSLAIDFTSKSEF